MIQVMQEHLAAVSVATMMGLRTCGASARYATAELDAWLKDPQKIQCNVQVQPRGAYGDPGAGPPPP